MPELRNETSWTYLLPDGDYRTQVTSTPLNYHQRCALFFETTTEPMVVPQLVLVEAGYLVGKLLGPAAEAGLLRELGRSLFEFHPVEPDDLARMADLIDTYADLRLGTVDACVIATAERLGETTIATLDRRHFTVVRPSHVDAFHLVP